MKIKRGEQIRHVQFVLDQIYFHANYCFSVIHIRRNISVIFYGNIMKNICIPITHRLPYNLLTFFCNKDIPALISHQFNPVLELLYV